MSCALWADASACAILYELESPAERDAFRDTLTTENALSVLADPAPGPEDTVIERDRQREVEEFVNTLPPQLRLITDRFYWHGESQTQIAGDLGVTRSAVCHALRRVERRGRAFFGVRLG